MIPSFFYADALFFNLTIHSYRNSNTYKIVIGNVCACFNEFLHTLIIFLAWRASFRLYQENVQRNIILFTMKISSCAFVLESKGKWHVPSLYAPQVWMSHKKYYQLRRHKLEGGSTLHQNSSIEHIAKWHSVYLKDYMCLYLILPPY